MPKRYNDCAVPVANERDWEAEDAFRTLKRAKDIENNGDLMGRVRKYAETEKQVIKEVMGGRTGEQQSAVERGYRVLKP